MSADLPETVDVWRLVVARRVFEGRLPLSAMPRLGEVLQSTQGDADYVMEFGRDAFQVPFVALRVEAGLPLQCQRTLQVFNDPVQLEQRLGSPLKLYSGYSDSKQDNPLLYFCEHRWRVTPHGELQQLE